MGSGCTKGDKRAHRKLRKGQGKQFCFVYGLAGQDGRIRYIGQTRLTLGARLKWHFKSAINGKSPVCKWINRTMGVEIILIDGNATWDVSEILWIDRYRREGHDLVNVLRGGTDSVFALRRTQVRKRRA
jgi:hypothetical protein